MRRWTSGLLAALLLVLAGWVLAPTASACSCTGGTTADHALGADAVFSGRLADREVVGGTALHVFAVDAVYAGQVAARQGVLSPASGASCGLELAGGGHFLVFAVREDDRLVADLCGGTTVWTPQAASEVQVLTGVSAPEPGSAGTELPGGPSDTALEAVVAVLLVAAFRRRAGPAATGGRVDRGRRAALLLLPTLSTHGYEVQHRETVERCARLAAEFLCRPVPR